ncbi:MAG TPA: Arm DNA-binding domain-containing protein [Roseateles sp.]|nr:Arm DNA-binding domain-containing protein [Roseateles sp.]
MRNILTPAGLQSQFKAAVDTARESGKSVKIVDGEGLMLVVRSAGASWVLRAAIQGRRKDITLGRWPAIGLKDARTLADESRRKVALGADVTAVKRNERELARIEASAKADSVRQLYLDWLKLRGTTISDVYRGNIEAAFMKNVLPALGIKPSHEVTRADCVAVLRKATPKEDMELIRKRLQAVEAHVQEQRNAKKRR